MGIEIAGFTSRNVPVGGVTLRVASGGAGPPVLLLHGFPQTHLAWRHVAPALAERHTVICPDLPGYGGSGPPAVAGPEGQAKRATAGTMVELMRALGHERFSVVGHDRGALVAFRAGLDHPEVVEHVGVLDILPTIDMWAALQGAGGVFAFHLYLLAHPPDLPERMIGAAPDAFFGHFLDIWATDPASVPADVRAAYLAAASTPEAVRAICDDYRASAFVDPAHEEVDRGAGRSLEMPVLAMWQDPAGRALPFDPLEIWSAWAPRLRTRVLPCGHFLPEERPEEVGAGIAQLLQTSR